MTTILPLFSPLDGSTDAGPEEGSRLAAPATGYGTTVPITHRPAAVPRSLVVGLALLVPLACSSSEDAILTSSTVPATVNDATTATDPSSDPTFEASGERSVDGSVATTTGPDDPVDDTTVPEWDDVLDDTCRDLDERGYESRKAAVAAYRDVAAEAGADDAAATALDERCGEALGVLEDAVALEARRDRLDRGDPPVSISQLRCTDGNYQFVATNETDQSLGVHVGFRVFVGDDDEPVSSADYPIVIWELEPGAAQGITGEYQEPADDVGYRCNLSARVFAAGDEGVDAAIPGVVDDELTGDDPTTWFGVLLGREVDGVGSGDVDAAAVTEDLRSTFYDDVYELNVGSEPADRVPTSVTICSDSVDQPGPDRMSFVYFVTYPDGDGSVGQLRHGLFRRGTDGQWRWLSAAQYFDSPDFYGCGRPGPQS